MSKLHLKALDVIPYYDPYQQGGIPTQTELSFSIDTGAVCFTQAEQTRTTTFRRVHGVELVVLFNTYPNAGQASQFFEDHKAGFQTILDNTEIVGRLDGQKEAVMQPEAQQAWDNIVFEAIALEGKLQLQDGESQFDWFSPEELRKNLGDISIEQFAKDMIAEYFSSEIVLLGGESSLVATMKEKLGLRDE